MENRALKIIGFLMLISPYLYARRPVIHESPDHKVRAVIISVGKVEGGEDSESRIEVRTPAGLLRYERDFSSEDGEHGFVVENAKWTQDSQFFVFSLSSSGGHQPWHHPSMAYLRRENTMKALDDYLGPISTADFSLGAPSTIKTEVWEKGPVIFDLKELTAVGKRNHKTADLSSRREIAPAGRPAPLMDINRASAGVFANLPGIGPELAHRIVDYRTKHGPFHHIEDLLVIRGIGPKKWKALRPYLRVGPHS